jgi:hypothetical protein
MASTAAFRGVAGNVLAFLTARNADFQGYWLMGYLVDINVSHAFDLLRPPRDWTTAVEGAHIIAAKALQHNVERQGLKLSQLRVATLHVSAHARRGALFPDAGRRWCNIALAIELETVAGRRFHAARETSAEATNPELYQRRVQEHWGP